MHRKNNNHSLYITTFISTLALAFAVGCGGTEELADSSDNIVGGRTGGPAAVGQVVIDVGGGRAASCTGTLIAPKVVLTAAHCVSSVRGDIVVSFAPRPGPTSAWYLVKSHKAHPGYNPRWIHLGYDVATLILHQAPAGIRPIPARTRALTNSDLNRTVRAVGYGMTASGRSETVGVRRYVDVKLNSITAGTVSTGTRGRTTCQGDSGGPHIMGGQVIGVTSYGPRRCQDGASTEARVDANWGWINGQIQLSRL